MFRVWTIEVGDKYEGHWLHSIYRRQKEAAAKVKELEQYYGGQQDVILTLHELK